MAPHRPADPAGHDPEGAMPATAAARHRPGRPAAGELDALIGKRARERRLALGLAQQQLAEMIGTTYQQAHKYEKGVNRISAGRLHVIAGALGVEPGYFFAGLGEDDPARPSAGQRQVLELSRSFAALSRPQQEALAVLARALSMERRTPGADAPSPSPGS